MKRYTLIHIFFFSFFFFLGSTDIQLDRRQRNPPSSTEKKKKRLVPAREEVRLGYPNTATHWHNFSGNSSRF